MTRQNKKVKKPSVRGSTERMTPLNKLTVSYTDLLEFEPITHNQEVACKAWDDGDHLVLSGTAGTGKTYLAMALAFEQVLDSNNDYDKVVVIRSIVPTRDPGFLPGKKQDKEDVFTSPYKNICAELFDDATAYSKLVNIKKIHFDSTSFIRGVTWNNSIIIVDEMQNMNFHELDTIITRVGKDCRIIFSGDYKQTDFKFQDEKDGIIMFLNIIEQMKNFTIINFTWEDIVRSDFVRDYIMTKEMLGY